MSYSRSLNSRAVATKLALEWSPQQIAGWLRQAYPNDPTMRVSHETIYLSLFVQSGVGARLLSRAEVGDRRSAGLVDGRRCTISP